MVASSVYSYLNPNTFLADQWTAVKEKNASVSVRVLAKALGLGAHGPLHQMLIGKRQISKNIVPKIADYFQLNEDETMYFDFLVKLSHANDSKAVDYYTSMMRKLVPKKSESFRQIVDFSFQKSPLNFFILELTHLSELPNDWKIIQKRLVFNYSQKDIQNSVKTLIDSNRVEVKNKILVPLEADNYTSVPDTVNFAARNCHKELCNVAATALETQDLDVREFNAYTFNMDQKQLPEIKKAIRKFIAGLATKYELKNDEANATYNLNVHFFKVANKE